tara:strand:+ start:73 stop:399 length:327 start_codon:yes stop_codon:yes gene_type:complete
MHLKKRKLKRITHLLITLVITNQNIFTGVNAFNAEKIAAQRTKRVIDQRLELIEGYMRGDNSIDICEITISASNSIKQKIKSLTRIEPDYNWEEIRQVLNKLNNDYCV